jgi:hypothetical protein
MTVKGPSLREATRTGWQSPGFLNIFAQYAAGSTSF